MIEIEPSLLSADPLRMGEQAKEARQAGANTVQIDVMDGSFVPNFSFGQDLVQALARFIDLNLDVHLMIEKPELHIERFVRAGASRVIVHREASSRLLKLLQSIKELGAEAGVAINPGTSVSSIEEVLDSVDVVQIMTVSPGSDGQLFIESQLEKISKLKRFLEQRNLSVKIAVDGGITTTTAPLAAKAGAEILVAGSSIFNETASVANNMSSLRNSLLKGGLVTQEAKIG